MRLFHVYTLLLAVGATREAVGQTNPQPKKPDSHDSAYAAMQQRGAQAMGFDQYTSTHRFNARPDGGTIRIERNVEDSAGVSQIRAHLRDVARAFGAGDFSTPEFVHMRMVPGTQVMAAKRSAITYSTQDVPRGAELHIITHDPEALAAIHEFLAFQRTEHHAM